MSNWAGSHSYAGTLVRPGSLAEAAAAVAGAERVRAVGTRHSFNNIVDSEQTLVSLDRLAYRHPDFLRDDEDTADAGGPEPVLDPLTGHVRVAAATRYADLARFLEAHG